MAYYVYHIEKDCFYISLGNKGLGFATFGETVMLCALMNDAGHTAGNDWTEEIKK